MQIVQSKSSLIEKIIRDKDGRLVRATFCIYENAGRMKARLVDFVYLNEKIITKVLQTLPGFLKKKLFTRVTLVNNLVSSPYFVNEILNWSGSKPRAPTL